MKLDIAVSFNSSIIFNNTNTTPYFVENIPSVVGVQMSHNNNSFTYNLPNITDTDLTNDKVSISVTGLKPFMMFDSSKNCIVLQNLTFPDDSGMWNVRITLADEHNA